MRCFAALVLGCVFPMALAEPVRGEQDSRPIKVYVHVQAEDSTLQAEVESYISRELRSLGDVEVVSTPILITVSIVLVGDGPFAISTVASRDHNAFIQRAIVEIALQDGGLLPKKGRLPEATWSFMQRGIGSSDELGHWVSIVPRDLLKSHCQRLVANIDAVTLKAERARQSSFSK